ncbi:hypothetical protein, partial [Mucilaginibacter sp.]|uniref:hypothetical protein n=1 Tax=Mucilaginibacter sp. TaxID=1882438 RepID=UPI0028427115
FIIICLLTSMRLIEKKPDYSGTWKLNTANSNFGGLKGAAMQLTIKQYADKLIIKRLLSANGNRDSISIDTFKFNVKKESVSDMFKHHIAYTGWSDDGKQLTKIVFVKTNIKTEKGENIASEQKAMITWSLSKDGKTLNIDEEITLGNLARFIVKLVYDKQ